MREPSARLRGRGLSGIGVALGTFLFAASLTPTLVPRAADGTGAFWAGSAFAAGYGGHGLALALNYLEMPAPNERLRRIANIIVAGICLVAIFLANAAEC